MLGIQIQPALTGLVAALRAAGYQAGVDPEELSPPCVWVQPRAVRDLTLAGDATLIVWAYLIVPNTETAAALTLLDDLLLGLADLDLSLDDESDAVDLTAALVLPASPNPLPAYRIALTLDLPGVIP